MVSESIRPVSDPFLAVKLADRFLDALSGCGKGDVAFMAHVAHVATVAKVATLG